MEIRHENFRDPAFIALLRKHDHRAGLRRHGQGKWPPADGSHLGLRLRPPARLSLSCIAAPTAARRSSAWAARVAAWRDGNRPTATSSQTATAPRQARRRCVPLLRSTPTRHLQAPKGRAVRGAPAQAEAAAWRQQGRNWPSRGGDTKVLRAAPSTEDAIEDRSSGEGPVAYC